MQPTRIKAPPVAHGGMEAKMGAKKSEMKKQIPVVMAVSPVRPPSWMPDPDSTKAVTGDEPKSEPTEIAKASALYAIVLLGKSPVSESTTPEKRAIEYSVPVASRIS